MEELVNEIMIQIQRAQDFHTLNQCSLALRRIRIEQDAQPQQPGLATVG